jgi:hypothetical protein
MAGMTSLIGAGVGLAGSLLGGSSQPKQRWRPMATSNLWGNVSFDKKNRTFNQSLSPWAQGISDTFQGNAQTATNSPLFGLGNQYMSQGAGDVLGAYGALNEYGMPDEALYQNAMGQLGQYGNLFGNLAGMAGNNPYAQQQMALGQQFMGAQAPSYDQVAAQRLGLLREQAAPFENRAYNSMQNKLFSQGRLGSTGGGRDIEAFARGLGQADTSRQLDSMGFAEQLYGRDQQNALAQRQMGANLFSGGVGNWMQGINSAGQLGQLGMGAATGQYNLGMGWNNAGYGRAQDRLARTSEMFGFGQDIAGAGAQQAGTWMNLLSGLTGEQSKMYEQGLRAAGPSTPQGGNTTGASVGGFLQGLGGGMLTGTVDPGSWFGGGSIPGQTINQFRGFGNEGVLSPIDITAKRM